MRGARQQAARQAMMGEREQTTRFDPNLSIQRTYQETELGTREREIFALAPVQLTTAAQTIFTVPAQTFYHVNMLQVSNITGGAETFTAYQVASGGAPATNNAIYTAQNVAANQTFEAPLWGLVFPAGSSLQILASANTSLNVFVNGHSITGGDLL